jgi:hypothetical protein
MQNACLPRRKQQRAERYGEGRTVPSLRLFRNETVFCHLTALGLMGIANDNPL